MLKDGSYTLKNKFREVAGRIMDTHTTKGGGVSTYYVSCNQSDIHTNEYKFVSLFIDLVRRPGMALLDNRWFRVREDGTTWLTYRGMDPIDLLGVISLTSWGIKIRRGGKANHFSYLLTYLDGKNGLTELPIPLSWLRRAPLDVPTLAEARSGKEAVPDVPLTSLSLLTQMAKDISTIKGVLVKQGHISSLRFED